MLDVHIALSADTPQEWLDQCVMNAQVAVANAGYPVALHLVDGVPGHIGLARANGFAQGNFTHVTFIDDDDFVSPNAFACLPLGPRLMFTRERLLQNDQDAGIGDGHHLAVLRRPDAMAHDWASYPAGGEAELYRTLGEAVQLPDIVYTHRIYRSKGRALRNARG